MFVRFFLFVCSFVRLFVCSFVRLFVCSFVRLFVLVSLVRSWLVFLSPFSPFSPLSSFLSLLAYFMISVEKWEILNLMSAAPPLLLLLPLTTAKGFVKDQQESWDSKNKKQKKN